MADANNEAKLRQIKAAGYKAQIKYNKANLKHVGVNLNKQTEAEYLAYWESLPNKRQWLLAKMREDMGV